VNRKAFGIRLVCAIAVSLAACAVADAQPLSGGPFSGLFRGSPRDQPNKLDITGSAFAAWDDNPLAQLPNGGGTGFAALPDAVKPGIASAFQGSIVYGFAKTGTRSQVSLFGNGSFQVFESSASSNRLTFQSYNLGGSFRTGITNKVSLTFTGAESYAPYYQYAPFLQSTASQESPVGTDYGFAVGSDWVRTSNATISLDDRFTKRSSIGGQVTWIQQDMSADDRQIETEAAGMRFSHNVTRKLTFSIGYTVSQSWYTIAGERSTPFTYGNVDIGLGYGDGLTFRIGRNYTLSMNVGASLARNNPTTSIAGQSQTQLLATGNATLSRSIGRTWQASIGYNRGVTYMVGFTQPFIGDGASAGLSGPIVERLFFSLGAGASRSQQVFNPETGDLVAYTGSAKLTYGLFGNVGLFAQASYYKYTMPPAVLESFGFVPQLERRSVSAGVSTWLPLIKPPRARRSPNDQQAGQ